MKSKIVWEGKPSPSSVLKTWQFWLIFGLTGIFVLYIPFVLLKHLFYTNFITYRLYEDKIEFEFKIPSFSQKIEQIQFFRIRDMKLATNMFNMSTITIFSTDKTSPVFKITDITDGENVYSMISELASKKVEKRTFIVE